MFDDAASRVTGRINLYLTVYAETPPELVPRLIRAAGEKGLFDLGHQNKVKLHIETDKALLGGFIAECGGLSWDCSLRTRLVELTKVIRKL
jgi:hypothetical protein